MADRNPDRAEVARLAARFLTQRRELGDGFWPAPEPRAASEDAMAKKRKPAAERVAEEPVPYDARPSYEDPVPARTKDPAAAPVDHVAGEGEPPPEAQAAGDIVPRVLKTDFDLTPDLWELPLVEFGVAISECLRCPLGEGRTRFVFGEGNPGADILFVGEGPGGEEDKQGRPFVGPAGKLLTKMIEAMRLRREDVYIANVVKCRPPNNRQPTPFEAEKCLTYLRQQIKLIQPRFICALGRVAALGLLGIDDSLSRMRGKWFDFEGGARAMVTYHPAALLRNPGWKREAWLDLKRLRFELDGTEL